MKTPKSEYNAQGRWIKEKPLLKGAVRKIFTRSPQYQEALKRVRVVLPPENKKDGTLKKVAPVRYRCESCNELFQLVKNKKTLIQIDHINPVIAFNKTLEDLSVEEIFYNIICSLDNLQALCAVPKKMNDGKDSCHHKKTKEENFIRKKITALGSVADADLPELVEKYRKDYVRAEALKAEKERLKEEKKKARQCKKTPKLQK